jgi:uncharacterized membrane protein
MEKVISENDLKLIWERLQEQDQRISDLERHLLSQNNEDFELREEYSEKRNKTTFESIEKDELLEYRIGQFWFAKIGILAFIVGIMFVLTLPHKDLPIFLPFAAGIVLSLFFLLIPRFFKSLLPQLSGYVIGGGFVLLYYTVARMHFLEESPLIDNSVLALLFLNIVFIISFAVSIKRESVYLAGLSILFGYITSLLSGNPYQIFISIILLASISVYVKIRYKWETFLALSIFTGYLTHFLWLINNPILGNELTFVSEPGINILFLFIYYITFSMAYIVKRDEQGEPSIKLINITGNSICFFGLLLISGFTGKETVSPGITLTIASILFLGHSAFFWLKERSKYLTFILVMTGYLALSIAIIYEFRIPNGLIWLCWQSIIVISTAVWYKSRFIITANFFIYMIILAAYLFMADGFSIISLSFGAAALLTARILNWKKDSLELKTEHMRNSYLIITLLYIPFIFHNIMPQGYAAISWLGVAIMYYLFSLILKNKKYRWMSFLTLIMSIIYISILGLTSSELIYKIMSFLVLGSVLIAISVFYSKMKNSSTARKI